MSTIHQRPRVGKPDRFDGFERLNQWLVKLFTAVDAAQTGKMDCVVDLTLTANAATTTFEDYRLSAQSAVVFDPMTANAAAELAAGTMYVTDANRGSQTWTVTHANNAQTDRTFRVAILG